jgi:polysaccharide biosynthesis protein PslG
MPITKRYQTQLFVLFGLLIFAGCVSPTPIAVYVTPTPQMGPSDAATLIPTAQVAASVTDAVAAPTSTLPPTNTPGTIGPTVTFIGPVVGPEYTLPPSDTPPITATPSATNTPTIGPSLTPIPSETPGGPTPTPLPGLDAMLIGLQIHPELEQEDWDNAMHRATQLGVGWIKVQVSWKLLQPNGADEFSTEFQRLELYLQNADFRGFRILVSVAKAPDWSRANQDADGPPDDPQALANFLSFFLNRNRLGDRIDAVEVWNEPNLVREWTGRPLGGAEYMRYFDPAYDAIRAFSSTISIVTAAPAPTGNSDGSADDRTYLQQMYNAGLAAYTDVAVGFHPYSWGNSPDAHCCNAVDGESWDDDPHFFFANTLEDYREIMVNNNDADADLWATEFGWATWEGFPGDAPEVWMTYNNPLEQANYTLRAFEIGQQLDYMGPMFLWNLNFADANPQLIEDRDERIAYSLVLPEGNPQERPLYWMLYDTPRINPTATPSP